MSTKEERILEAAWQLFYRHGYRKVSMSDIAQAGQMSRPSLYASFANKEAIFAALVQRQRDKNQLETAARLQHITSLEARLACVFDIWIIEPVATVIESENATELLANCLVYAPDAVADLYARFETQLIAVLKPESSNSPIPAEDIAYILRLATTSLKASTETEPKLRYMVKGLITMVLATVNSA